MTGKRGVAGEGCRLMNHDGFLQAILDDPDDDAVRLIYADWLEEQGDPHGEFIRVQCELASGGKGPQRSRLVEREQELLRQHEVEWTKLIRRLVKQWMFRRGFIESVMVKAGQFFESVDSLFRQTPVRQLQLCGGPPFRSGLGSALATCPHLRRIQTLDLSYTDLGSNGLQALAVSEYLDGLTTLNVSYNNIGNGGARALAGSPLLARLHHLDLSYNEIGPAGLRDLASAFAAQGEGCLLRSLDLRGNGLGSAGIRVIRGSPVLRRVAKW
jgi:uncharacterized protein (TIGR02996 family)